MIQRIRYGIADPSRAFMTVFNSTPLERKLAVLLGIPLNGVDPALCRLGSKFGSRGVFREAGVPLPEGAEGLRSEDDIVGALGSWARAARHPPRRRQARRELLARGTRCFATRSLRSAALREALAALTFAVGRRRARGSS